MKILKAAHLGFCFGVRDAIGLALDHPGPITILGDLVHNETVLEDLRSHGVRFASRAEDIPTPAVMITAHGASERAMSALRQGGHRLMEATCPLVRRAHRAVEGLVRKGYHPVIIGKEGHVEVRGMTEDLVEYDVIASEADVSRLKERSRFGVVAQTTQPVERTLHLVRLIQGRFPSAEVRFVDTICQPTKLRQTAAIEMALHSDVVVVIGGAGSNNTRELVTTCSRYCSRVHHVQTEADLRPEWFTERDTVGLTAGTSTPDETIQAVEQYLTGLTVASESNPIPSPVHKEAHETALATHAL
jgi:4-hydroxy-3-methylbut-2-enyl diphosphate reductase